MNKPKINRSPFSLSKALFHLFLWGYAFVSLYPLIWMLFYSFKNNDEIFVSNPFGFPTTLRFENYIKAWSQYNVPQYFLNSVIVAVGTVVITISFALLFSYATSRMRWKGKEVIRIYVALGMFIPVQAVLIPVARTVNQLGFMGSHLALIIPYSAFNLSFATMVFYAFFVGLPVELEEAACIDGATIFQTFFHIMVPTVKPAIWTLVIFTFLNSWNEFILANVLVIDQKLKTLPLGILFFQGQFTTDWGAMGATMVIASLPTILLYIFFSNQVEKALTVGGAVKG
ncbi:MULTISPECIES: carbohydrate ABC transporter permease [unclassified Fusibacter]|uniref:carbohydrate ABC transporter permease n=1 Tax=unclassified Fusibacter TaxID=2624464 RepID=UPI00101175E9|nr:MULTISPECIES: carbohydrate ABC transporter permease [unclassified Fusibacter]MCK8060079.1 carbohydrate ABC transporter permease [Fusibacter sp. A2]NPE22221.1 carbohydrate ABC transporter permease [Fusibacter sp. A1]RXV60995.1 carbohydrate ABC transporter permease [Fusibacter sp. A1]